MKNINLIIMLLFACFTHVKSFAGIPVLDLGTVAQTTALVAEAGKQYKQLQSQLAQAKELYNSGQKAQQELFKGFTDFNIKDLIENPTLSTYLPTGVAENLWNQRDVTTARTTYNLVSKNEATQKNIDLMLSELSLVKASYEAMNQRTENLKALSSKMDKTYTPQAKADLLNAITMEQTAIMHEKYNFVKQQQVLEESHQLEFVKKFGF